MEIPIFKYVINTQVWLQAFLFLVGKTLFHQPPFPDQRQGFAEIGLLSFWFNIVQGASFFGSIRIPHSEGN